MYDLHVHTNASDGVLSPVEVIRLALKSGLDGLAITDHDTLQGVAPAQDFIRSHQIQLDFIPGIEINTDYGEDEVHILGYFVTDQDSRMTERLAYIQRERITRAENILARLSLFGIDIDMDQVRTLAGGRLIGRPHIARALIAAGHAQSEADAFARYIGRNQPAYVPRYKFSPQEAIHLIDQAGGISVLAHPGLIHDKAKIDAIIEMGIAGLEVYYPEHDVSEVKELKELARRHNLLTTGGSDFHGTGPDSRTRLGYAGVDRQTMETIRDFYQHK